MAVNAAAWKKFPIADRDQSFNADAAITRLANASAGNVEAFNQAFLWRNDQGPPNNKNSYRLPIADIINNRWTLVPHAVFTAAAILSGAHGGLVGVVGDEEKGQLRTVVTEIYSKLRDMYNDPRLIPPWERNDVPPSERPNRQLTAAGTLNLDPLKLPVGQQQRWSAHAARKRLRAWAQDDLREYRKAFLWWDNRKDTVSSYLYPVADVVDGKLTLAPDGVALMAALTQNPDSLDVPDDARQELVTLVAALQQRLEQKEEPVNDDTLVRPPAAWFDDPQLTGPSPLTVTADGKVSGHLALWNVCHFGIQDTCRMAPRSNTDYKFFANGHVLTADGSQRRVGRLTVGTGHAHLRLGYVPASDHYDNTGTAVAVVAAGEDLHGIWVAGAVVPGTSEAKVQELRRSPLSGDWRPTQYGLELVAALAVNNPGFPVMGFTASGETTALLSAGMVLSPEDLESITVQQSAAPDPDLVERFDKFQQRALRLTAAARSRRLDTILKNAR